MDPCSAAAGTAKAMETGKPETFIPASHIEELIREMGRMGLTASEAASILREAERRGITPSPSGRLVEEREEPAPTMLAEAILRILSSRACDAESLKMLAEHLGNIVKRKGGEEEAIDPQLLEKARRLLIRAIMPSLRHLLVPKWIFDSLERELKLAQERARHRELEAERLKQIAKSLGAEPTPIRLYRVSGLLEEEPAGTSGITAKIICPHCREPNNVQLPPRQEAEELLGNIYIYRLHCSSCLGAVDLEPAKILHVIDEQAKVKPQLHGSG